MKVSGPKPSFLPACKTRLPSFLPFFPTCTGAHVKELCLEVAVVPRPPGQEERAAVGPRQPADVQQDLETDRDSTHDVHGRWGRVGVSQRGKHGLLELESIKGDGSLMCIISAVSLVAEDVDVELVGDVQDQLHQLVVALKDLQLGLPRT